MKTFLKYLLASGFDLRPLLALSIKGRESKEMAQLFEKVGNLNNEQIAFLVDQATIAKGIYTNRK